LTCPLSHLLFGLKKKVDLTFGLLQFGFAADYIVVK